MSCTSNRILALKKSNKYYYQLQVAMHCTGKKWCDFVARTCEDIHIEYVEYDGTFFHSFLPKPKEFFFNGIPPKLTLLIKLIHEPAWWKNGTKE